MNVKRSWRVALSSKTLSSSLIIRFIGSSWFCTCGWLHRSNSLEQGAHHSALLLVISSLQRLFHGRDLEKAIPNHKHLGGLQIAGHRRVGNPKNHCLAFGRGSSSAVL